MPPLAQYIRDRVLIEDRGHLSPCWVWKLKLDAKGYGRCCPPGVKSPLRVHRIAYTVFVGEIPEGLQIDHLCRVRSCCNPAHLEPVTCSENIRRGAISRRAEGRTVAGYKQRPSTHCKNGHAFTAENTCQKSNGRRQCRLCQRTYQRIWRRARQKGGA